MKTFYILENNKWFELHMWKTSYSMKTLKSSSLNHSMFHIPYSFDILQDNLNTHKKKIMACCTTCAGSSWTGWLGDIYTWDNKNWDISDLTSWNAKHGKQNMEIFHQQWDIDGIFLPSGKLLHIYGKSPFLMGKSTLSMVIFHSYVSLPEGIDGIFLTNKMISLKMGVPPTLMVSRKARVSLVFTIEICIETCG